MYNFCVQSKIKKITQLKCFHKHHWSAGDKSDVCCEAAGCHKYGNGSKKGCFKL